MAEPETHPWTIQRLLTWTTDFFQRQGSDAPRLAAEVLLSEALGIPRIQLYTRFAEIPVEPQLGRFRDWVKRHAAGEPVAYLVGHREFYSLRFEVSSAVLIPRPETEHLVLAAIDALATLPASERQVIDIGTGSGCIAITLATQVPDTQVVAVDLSESALEVAKRNAETHGVSDRIRFIQSDLLAALAGSPPVSLIVSNPPYVGRSEQEALDKNVRKYEPATALFGGERGDEISQRLITQAVDLLRPGGWLMLESSPMLANVIGKFVESTGVFDTCKIIRDYAKLDRLIVAQRKPKA